MTHKLTPGFTVIDAQSTPSGYYQISFRSTDGRTVIATQEGRGGCNNYLGVGGIMAAFDEWLATNADLAVHWYKRIGYPELGEVITKRDIEWQDQIVGAIIDLVEVKVLSVEG